MSRYFSNGTEGRAWEALWCQRCENDHSMHDPETAEGGCQYMLFALVDQYEDLEGIWIEESEKHGFTFPPAVRCTKFKGCDACGHGDVTLNDEGYPSPVRQREWMRPFGSTEQGVLVTDNVLVPPGAAADPLLGQSGDRGKIAP